MLPAQLAERRNMGYRKLYFNDVVKITSPVLGAHLNHIGRVAFTKVKTYVVKSEPKKVVTYGIACECGSNLKPLGAHLDLVAIAEQDDDYPSVHDSRMIYFLKSIYIKPSYERLQKQVDKVLASLKIDRDKRIITRRFGLDGKPSKTEQAVADDEGITRQRVHQIEQRVLNSLVKEKHE